MVLMTWIWLLLLLIQRVTSGTPCNNSQYFDYNSQTCKACSSCKSDELLLRRCSDFDNTLCDKNWIWRVEESYAHESHDKSGSPVKHSIAGDLNSVPNSATDLNHSWDVTEHIFIGLLCLASVVLTVVIVFAIYVYRRRELDGQYSGAWSVWDKKSIVLVNNDYHYI